MMRLASLARHWMGEGAGGYFIKVFLGFKGALDKCSIYLFIIILMIKGALDKYNIIPNFFPKKLGFLYH